MSDCPECGLAPAATTQDAATGAELFTDENGHYWPAEED